MTAADKPILEDAVRYSREHTWAKREDHHITIGITDYAQAQLGSIIFVELPEPEAAFEQNDVFGTVESAKTVSDLYMPLSGKVIAVNHQLEDAPELVNSEPYDGGWMVKILPTDLAELDSLLSASAYREMINS